ncbi:ATP-dependent endonuclease [Actinobacillus succinogenes]|uniref:ATP-dependent endonuclease of the OLD family n=1 Tax=Actinobacillus succinogenes (strain ATCC 55618 / DSM 22257 / CCUG 43843 / 130Z) TaxID=339671 RepID=A6VPB5_ACTSZ|nr:ATP-dependent endonuclease [Actinobacillus succinogenes]ABR74812.1 ATP-dependent endonuclease of the OLD family [Actinobacillus succinogenes 130Z]PHI40774.1 ATP-dependent endonuclease [Actinobacillus succinogenes]
MYLRQCDLVGFRGINRLSIHLRPHMVLIGENAWGKSSLLAALSLILNNKNRLYRFTQEDFHHEESTPAIMLLFTFSERDIKEDMDDKNQSFQAVFVPHDDGYDRIYLRVEGEMRQNDVITTYSFLDELGEPICLENTEEVALSLICRHPIYRFRDARLNSEQDLLNPQNMRAKYKSEDRQFQAVGLVLQHYFMSSRRNDVLAQKMLLEPTALWDELKLLCQRLKQDETRELRTRLVEFLQTLFISDAPVRTSKYHRPVLLFEDPEARLHPRMIAILWELMQYLPIQRITTTNSVELVSQAELKDICRLVRYTDRTLSYQLFRRELGKEDLRRLTFHIHHNRSLALFSRTWILVEGETEVWILAELAKLLDINLSMEGIRIVEFAQSGLRPLIKYAKAMGIEWYVLTDGDEAGRKYSETAHNLLEEHEMSSQRITTLPKLDIEHFFYTEGFENVFIRLARWERQGRYLPMRKIIQRAIQRTSKPDLAIALSAEMERRGTQSIPLLFKRLFSKVLNLTRTQ